MRQPELKKVETAGGPPITLCSAVNGKGGTWNREGVIVFAPSHNSNLRRVPAAGGKPTPVTEVDTERFNGHRFPQFLPDGQHFIYVARDNNAGLRSFAVFAASLGSSERKLVVETPASASLTPKSTSRRKLDGFTLLRAPRHAA